MDTERVELIVFFEEPFWVGVFERISKGRLSVCKVTFGAEPKDYDIWDFILKHYDKLKFSPSIEAEVKKLRTIQSADSAMPKNSCQLWVWGPSRSRYCKCSMSWQKLKGNKSAKNGRKMKRNVGLI